MTPTLYKYFGIALAVILALSGAYFKGHHDGYAPEHDKFVAYQAAVKATGDAQNAAAEAKDKLAKEQANEAQQGLISAVNGISDYYNQHPVIRMRNPNTCGGELPKTAGDPKGSDGVATDGYFSPYSPELTELIANRLDQLQKLLVKDGVTVE